jgi:hypothetical protein
MNRKDYVLIADALRCAKPTNFLSEEMVTWNDVVNNLCINLKFDNSRFDEKKFRKACNDN